MAMKRKIIKFYPPSFEGGYEYALCDDGSVWLHNGYGQWELLDTSRIHTRESAANDIACYKCEHLTRYKCLPKCIKTNTKVMPKIVARPDNCPLVQEIIEREEQRVQKSIGN